MIAPHSAAPVRAADRVSDVLARDDALVDIFVRHAPQFAKLRLRGMRRIMARLVSVEDAAHIAGIPAAQLVAELNEALGLAGDASREPAAKPAARTTAQTGTPPAMDTAAAPAPRHPAARPVVDVDVREDLRAGREPFARIMSAVNALAGDEVLRLRATFEPVPLFTVLGKRGFAHEATAHAADDWSVWFWRPEAAAGLSRGEVEGLTDVAAQPLTAVSAHAADPPFDAGESPTYLDVRGLSPPEPMLRTLSALESIAEGRTLVQVNDRVPQFLLPLLAERGFAYEIDTSRGDRVLVRIWHAR